VISDTLYEAGEEFAGFKVAGIGRFSLRAKEATAIYTRSSGKKWAKKPVVAHTKVQSSAKAAQVFPPFKLQHIRKDGSVGGEHALKTINSPLARARATCNSQAMRSSLRCMRASTPRVLNCWWKIK